MLRGCAGGFVGARLFRDFHTNQDLVNGPGRTNLGVNDHPVPFRPAVQVGKGIRPGPPKQHAPFIRSNC